MNSLQGHFLVAAPHQLDPNFVESVILVVQHMPRGAVGLILNCPASEKDIPWRRMAGLHGLKRRPLFFGGPVTGPYMAVHTNPEQADLEVLADLYFTARGKHIAALADDFEHPYKLFLGYTGWGPGQLDYEVSQGVWRTMPGKTVYVFSAREDLWQKLSRHVAESAMQSMLHVRHIPHDPLVN
jgi:putative transcriptional regulator